MKIEDIHQKLVDRFGSGVILGLHTEAHDPWIEVASAKIVDVSRFLHDEPGLAFDALNDLCGVDYLEMDPKKKNPPEPHIEVVYHLYSYSQKHWLVIKAKLPRWQDGVAGKLPVIDSVAGVWAIADW